MIMLLEARHSSALMDPPLIQACALEWRALPAMRVQHRLDRALFYAVERGPSSDPYAPYGRNRLNMRKIVSTEPTRRTSSSSLLSSRAQNFHLSGAEREHETVGCPVRVGQNSLRRRRVKCGCPAIPRSCRGLWMIRTNLRE